MTIEHIKLALGLHRETVDAVLNFDRRIGVEMAKAAAKIWRATHLPEQPRHTFGALAWVFGDECAEFLGQMQHDRSGFKQALRRVAGPVHHRGNFGVRVDVDKAGSELIPFADVDQPRVILGALVPGGQ